MSDITTKMEGGKTGESFQASAIGKAPICTHSAFGGEGKAPPSTPSAFGGENAEAPAIKIKIMSKIKTERDFANEVRIKEPSEEQAPPCAHSACGGEGAATMRMPAVDVRELSDEMLIFWLQKLAPEKYGKAARCTQSACDGEAVQQRAEQQRAEIRGQRSEEMTESRFDFDSQDAGDELVMSQDCPEFPNQADLAASGGPTTSVTPPGIQSACGEAVQQRAEIRDQRSEEMTETLESASGFIPQATGGELHMPQDCPEIERGKAQGSRLKAQVQNNEDCTPSACGGEDTEAPAIKIKSKSEIKTEREFANEVRVQEYSEEKTPHFGENAETGRPGDAERVDESKQSSVINDRSLVAAVRNVRSETPGEAAPCTTFAGSAEDGNYPQISGVSQRATPGYSNCIPSGYNVTEMLEIPESPCGFVLQDTDAELFMQHDCPEFSNRASNAPDVRQVARGNELCRPFRAWDFGGRMTQGGARGLAVPWAEEFRAFGPGGAARPESRSDFVLQGADGEWVRWRECPEFWRGKAKGQRLNAKVKAMKTDGRAVEDDRSPSPGGSAGSSGRTSILGEIRRGMSEAGGGLEGKPDSGRNRRLIWNGPRWLKFAAVGLVYSFSKPTKLIRIRV